MNVSLRVIQNFLNYVFQAQLSGKSSGGGGSSGSNTNAGPGEGKDVVELTDANFRKKVLNSDKVKGNVISMINDKSIKGVLKRERKSIDLKLCGKLPRIDLYFSLFIRHRYTIIHTYIYVLHHEFF